MKFVGGPFDGKANAVAPDPDDGVVDVPSRMGILTDSGAPPRWRSVEHFYEVEERDGELVAVYRVSQFEW